MTTDKHALMKTTHFGLLTKLQMVTTQMTSMYTQTIKDMKSKVFCTTPFLLEEQLNQWLINQSFIKIINMTQSEAQGYVVCTILYTEQ